MEIICWGYEKRKINYIYIYIYITKIKQNKINYNKMVKLENSNLKQNLYNLLQETKL